MDVLVWIKSKIWYKEYKKYSVNKILLRKSKGNIPYNSSFSLLIDIAHKKAQRNYK